ncbi:hypothetical protein [Paenibacillus sp. 2TAB19]|uniref:hypothetical protein n=1 Tax=Paenibacillus sp. 2TAB19 TaxID=3233003 RepID=UPI003F944988
MCRDQLRVDALAAGRAARHNLALIRREPERIEETHRKDAENYLQMMISFEAYEMKNARLAGRTSLRTRLKNLVIRIISHERKMA